MRSSRNCFQAPGHYAQALKTEEEDGGAMLVIRGVSKWHTAGKPAGRACRTAVPLQPHKDLASTERASGTGERPKKSRGRMRDVVGDDPEIRLFSRPCDQHRTQRNTGGVHRLTHSIPSSREPRGPPPESGAAEGTRRAEGPSPVQEAPPAAQSQGPGGVSRRAGH